LIALDKLDKIGVEGVEKEFAARGINEVASRRLLSFFGDLRALDHAAEIAAGEEPQQKQQALNKAILGRIVEFVGDNEMGAAAVDDLRSILEFADASGIARYVRIDPTLARGLSYYTGAIMEINVKDLPGSLGGGGRYDNLLGMFLGQDVPACGFSLGLDRIIVVMTERQMFPEGVTSSPADVMVAIWNESSLADAIRLARDLRNEGLAVDLYSQADRLGKQFKYAAERHIRFVALIGDDEREKGEVAIKNIESAEQQNMKREHVGEELRKLVAQRKRTS
jgi:histidyl-tRNA synthetase